MKLDYGTMISAYPIPLNIGTIRKPKLSEIADPRIMGFDTFGIYESFLSMTPEQYFTKINPRAGEKLWFGISEELRKKMTIFSLLSFEDDLREIYTKIFQFFFEEPVIFMSGFFIILNDGADEKSILSKENVKGIITEDTFFQIVSIIKQICGLSVDEEDTSKMKFKNEMAAKLFERMKKAKEKSQAKKHDINFSLPNIISVVASCHPSLNYTNIYDLTVYQLLDCFDRLRNSAYYDIDKTRVSVWGDEKKQFKPDLWYRNEYDKQ